MAGERDDVIGVSADAAARVAGVTRSRARRWEKRGFIEPRVRRELTANRFVRIYGFEELVEMFVVRELERLGAHVLVITRLVETVRSPETPEPLRELEWAVEHGEVFVRLNGAWFGSRRPIQGVMGGMLHLDEIRDAVRKAVRNYRLDNERGAVSHRRGTLGSKEVFTGTRTPVSAVHSYLNRGAADAEILEAFPHLAPADIAEARRRYSPKAS